MLFAYASKVVGYDSHFTHWFGESACKTVVMHHAVTKDNKRQTQHTYTTTVYMNAYTLHKTANVGMHCSKAQHEKNNTSNSSTLDVNNNQFQFRKNTCNKTV